jgi:uncharacterized protein YigE (DUF2233 family)
MVFSPRIDRGISWATESSGFLMIFTIITSVFLAAGGDLPIPGLPPAPPLPTGMRAERMAEGPAFYDVVWINLKQQTLELFWKDPDGKAFESFAALESHLQTQGRSLVFATNAGIYARDLTPLGLHIAQGDTHRTLNQGKGGRGNFFLKPTGVFYVDEAGAHIVTIESYAVAKYQPTLAVQSGPLLVIEGALHPKFEAASESRYIRNGIGVLSPEEVVFVLSNRPVNFHTFASFFRDKLGCQNALYLDGTLSDFYLPALRRQPKGKEFVGIFAVSQSAPAKGGS